MKTSILGFALLAAMLPLAAHHELRAEFDPGKPVSLRGIVTRFDWNNPHALLYIDVKDASSEIVNWAVEWASPLELRKAGWTMAMVKAGDSVTVEALLARAGSKLAAGRAMVLTSGKPLTERPETEASPARSQAKPTPRCP